MSWPGDPGRRPRRLFGRDVEGEVRDELRFHMEERVDELVARGLDASAAREEAARRLGDASELERRLAAMGEREERRRRRREWLGSVWQDVRFGARSLRRSPGFAMVAVLTLALGIGANTAVFSVVNGVLLRPLPYPEPERVVHLGWQWQPGTTPTASLSAYKFEWWREHARSFSGMATYGWMLAEARLMELSYPDGRRAELVVGERGEGADASTLRVSHDFFEVVGFEPRLGRGFTAEEHGRGGPEVVVLTDGFWRARTGADPGVIGREIRLEDRPHTIVGVLPPEFAFPPSPDAQLLVPLRLEADPRDRGHNWEVIARVDPAVPVAQARAEAESLSDTFRALHPEQMEGDGGERLVVQTYADIYIGRGLRTTLWVLLGAVGFVLLIACANVANLLLARGSARRREIAVRATLGAGRGRIVRQLVTESLVLALLAGTAGLALGVWSTRVLLAAAPAGIPRTDAVGLDTAVFGFALGAALPTGLLFGLAAAWPGSRADLIGSVKAGGRSLGGVGRLGRWLVGAEAALAFVLLTGAGLLIASFLALRWTDLGFQVDAVTAVTFRKLPAGFEEPARRTSFEENALARLRTLPGVSAAAAATNLPLERGWNIPVTVEGRPDASEGAIEFRAVSPDYFAALGIGIVRGRAFDAGDVAMGRPVVLINEATARRYWPDENPIGKRLTIGEMNGEPVMPLEDPPREIVGVVADHRDIGVAADVRRTVFVPFPQAPAALFRGLRLLLRSERPVAAPALLDAIRASEPAMPAPTVTSLDSRIAATLAQERFNARLMTTFAMLALALTAVGIYGVVAYGVRQRTAEIGVRMALGARGGDVMRMVVRQGIRPVVLGLLAGIGASFAVARVLRSMLADVSTTDPVVYVVVAVVLTGVGAFACWLPARRAARLDPVRALRSE